MLKMVICKVCEKELGLFHQYQRGMTKRQHLLVVHREKFDELMAAYNRYQELVNECGVGG